MKLILSIFNTLLAGTVNERYNKVYAQPEEQLDMESADMVTTRLNCRLFYAFAMLKQTLSTRNKNNFCMMIIFKTL